MSYRPTFATEMSNVDTNKTVYVESLNAFPDPIAGGITLEADTTYIWSKPVNTGTNEFVIPDDGNITLTTTNTVANNWVTEITTGQTLLSGNIGRMFHQGLDTVSLNGGRCYDFSPGPGVGVIPNLFLSEIRIVGFDKIADMDGIALIAENNAYILNGAGFTLNDMSFLTLDEQNFVLQTGDHITMTGNLTGFAFIRTIVGTPSTGDAVLNLDSALNITNFLQVSLSGFIDTGGGTFFDPAGLDGTDPKVRVLATERVLDSYWIGSTGFTGGTTETVLSDTSTFVKIAGAYVNRYSERFIFSDGVGTYIGLGPIRITVISPVVINLTDELESDTIELSIFVNNVEQASSRVQKTLTSISSTVVDNSGNILVDSSGGIILCGSQTINCPSFYISDILTLESGDTFDVRVRNISNATNITATDLNLTGVK